MEDESRRIFAARRDRLRKLLLVHNLDAMLVSQPANRFYLSGFELHDPQPNESAGRLVVRANGEDWLATDSRYELAAARVWDPARVFIYGGRVEEDMGGLLKRSGSVVGIESRGVSVAFMNGLAKSVKGGLPAFINADGLVESLRLVKEPCEIAALKASFALNHRLFAWLAAEIANGPNMSEKDLSWLVEKFFRENGASETAFASIVASGTNAALPHAIPGKRMLVEGRPLLVDVGCRVENYCSDQTRTFWLGTNPSLEFEKTMELVIKAQDTAMAMMRPGVSCASVYRAAYKVFADAGVEKAFNHGLGHGVGLETHEGPTLSPRSDMKLEKGMTVTVEPGLYYPQWGGVRLEYTVLVEDEGVSIL